MIGSQIYKYSSAAKYFFFFFFFFGHYFMYPTFCCVEKCFSLIIFFLNNFLPLCVSIYMCNPVCIITCKCQYKYNYKYEYDTNKYAARPLVHIPQQHFLLSASKKNKNTPNVSYPICSYFPNKSYSCFGIYISSE